VQSYYNTALRAGIRSWVREEEGLEAIGARIADEFSGIYFCRTQAAGQPIKFVGSGNESAHAVSRCGL